MPIDRIIQVPVEKLITIIKEVPVTIEVERIVEKIVEVSPPPPSHSIG